MSSSCMYNSVYLTENLLNDVILECHCYSNIIILYNKPETQNNIPYILPKSSNKFNIELL